MSAIDELRETVARLRGPGGCPWDREQTHQSLCECLVEECSELLDTIDRADYEHMREELGDLLLQVVFHASIEEDCGRFDLDAVAKEVNEKLVRRHPHVFGDMSLETSEEVLVEWEKIKAAEKKNKPDSGKLFKDLPPRLPALLYAHDVFKQIQKNNLDADNSHDAAQIERLAENLTEERAGELLYNLAAACRLAKIDPESALRRSADKVVREMEERNG